MRTTYLIKGILALLLGLAMLTAVGCMGGNRNFTAGTASAQATGQLSNAKGVGRPDVGIKIGNLAPDFTVKDLSGQTVKLSDFRGKPVLVNFWATWCPPCRQEMPDLEKAYQKYQSEGMVFLGVDKEEDAGTVRGFVSENRYSWTFLLDSSGQVNRSYLVSAIPTSFFVDRDGIIRDTQIGSMNASLLEAKLGKIR